METAGAIADAVRSGRSSALAQVGEALARLESTGRDLGAVGTVCRDRALADARVVDADPGDLPLAGVPVVIKANTAVADVDGAGADAPLVARLRSAGALVIGTSTTPELCVFGTTDGEGFTARNPWVRDRTPGGSSGGSAALVAAGVVPLAHGNDGLGSIRIPAACCGLVGLKPGPDVVPHGDGSTWRGLSEEGPLATTVADLAVGLSVMAGDPFLASVTEPDALRIAVVTGAPTPGLPVAHEWQQAAHLAGEALVGQGHRIVSGRGAWPAWLGPALLAWWTSAVAEEVARVQAGSLQRRTRAHARVGQALGRTPLAAEGMRGRWKAHAEAWAIDWDVLLTPALAQSPPLAARWSERGWLANVTSNARYAPFAGPWNLAGWPAMTVPLPTRSRAGTPLAVQLVARPGGEDLLLGLAATLERVRPWIRTAPL